MRTIQSIAFDFSVHGVTPRVYGKQGDVNSRFVNISLFDQGTAWVIPDGALLSIRFRTPSGASGLYDALPDGSSAFEVFENTVCAALAEPIFAESGPVRCELSIASENAGITTWCFVVAVEGASISEQEIPEDYYNGFLSVAAQVAADAKRAEDAAKSFDTTNLMKITSYDPNEIVANAGGIERYCIPASEKNQPNGVAALNESGQIPVDAIPTRSSTPGISSWPSSILSYSSISAICNRVGNIAFVNIDVTFIASESVSAGKIIISGLPSPLLFPCVITAAVYKKYDGAWSAIGSTPVLWDELISSVSIPVGTVSNGYRFLVSFSYG